MTSPKRFWVGGATGFLGKTLVEHLAALGHVVVATSKTGGQIGNVPVASVDCLDGAAVQRSAEGCDGAFYAVGLVSRSPEDAKLLHEVNYSATRAALPALRAAGVPRVVYASTSGTVAVGTDPNQTFSEDHPTPHDIIARWPYYRSKLYAEQFAKAQNDANFQVVIVNPSLLLGPGDDRGSSTGDVRRLLAGSLPAVTGGGVSVVDVRDAAAGMLQAFERGVAGRRYLLSAANLPCSDFFGRIARIAGTEPPTTVLPANRQLAAGGHWIYRKALGLLGTTPAVDATSVDMGSHYWYCDTSRAERELGFSPRELQQTLRETISDITGR